MSFELVKGNLFDQNTEGLCHGVNLVGIMGAGIAVQFKKLYPEMFELYKEGCKLKMFKPGDAFHYQDANTGNHIFNLFSQDYPGAHAKIEWLKESLENVLRICETLGLKSIGLPMIGAGLGGLKSEMVLEVFKELGSLTEVRMVVCVL